MCSSDVLSHPNNCHITPSHIPSPTHPFSLPLWHETTHTLSRILSHSHSHAHTHSYPRSHSLTHTLSIPLPLSQSQSGMPYWKISRHQSPPWEAFPLHARDKIVVLSPDATDVLTEFSRDEVLPANNLLFDSNPSNDILSCNTYQVLMYSQSSPGTRYYPLITCYLIAIPLMIYPQHISSTNVLTELVLQGWGTTR